MKKAFTLIELLAVIVILGIIALIITPKITDTLMKNKEKLNDVQENNIKIAVKKWASDNIFLTPKEGETFTLTLGDLKKGGYIDDKVINIKTNEEYPDDLIVLITNNDGKLDYTINETSDNKFDPNAPIITLNGDVINYVEINTSYNEIDPPVEAYSILNEKLDYAKKIEKKTNNGYEITDNIDVSKLGQYLITYTAYDQVKVDNEIKNLSSNTYRTVIVRDTTPPNLLVDKNSYDYTITVSQNSEFTNPSCTVTDNSLENIECTVSGKVDTSKIGIYTLTYQASDSSKNKSTINVTVKVIDNKAPVIDDITADNVCSNESVKVTVKASDNIAVTGYNFSILGDTFNDEDYIYHNKNGTYYARVKDKEGNISSKKEYTISNIDDTVPDIEFKTNGYMFNNTSKDPFDVIVNVTDTGCGKDNISFKWCKTSSDSCIPNNIVTDNTTTIHIDEVSKNKICVQAIDGAKNISDVVCSEKYEYNLPIIQSFDSYSNEDFHSSNYKEKIKTVTIVNNKNIPANKIDSFDVSANKDGSVMAWLLPNESDASMYDLYIGGNGGVIANQNSSYLFYRFYNIDSMNLDLLDTSRVTNMSYMFSGCSSLTNLNLKNFDTSKVVDMSFMFSSDFATFDSYSKFMNLINLDLSNFNTSNVTNMEGMFNNCRKLTDLNLSSFNTSKVTNMGGMFNECHSLTTLDLSNFNTSNVTTFYTSFEYGNRLVFDVGIFDGCSQLNYLDIRNFDFSKISNYSYMFYLMKDDATVYVKDEVTQQLILDEEKLSINTRPSSWTTSNVLAPTPPATYETNVALIGNASSQPFEVTIKPSKWYTKDVTYKYCLSTNGNNCTPNVPGIGSSTTISLSEVGTYKICTNVSGNNVSNTGCSENYVVKAEPLMKSWTSSSSLKDDFHNSTYRSKIKTIEIVDNINIPSDAVASFDVSENQDNSVMAWLTINNDDNTLYDLKIGGDGGVIANPNSSYLFGNKYSSGSFLSVADINLELLDTSRVTDMSYMFGFCNVLTSLNLGKLDTSKVANMGYMFYSCKKLTDLNLSSFDTSKVANMGYMFYSCEKLTDLNLSSFDTSKVTDMSYMFDYCSSLTTLNLSNFNTSNVTSMRHMFNSCSSLILLDVNNFDTSKVTDMYCMFYKCSSLTELDVSNFNTSSVTNMSEMFDYCSGLTTLDVSNFNTSNVINMSGMFNDCNSLVTLDVSNFDTSNVTKMTDMFSSKNLTILDLSNFDTSKVTDMSGMFSYCSSLTTLDLSNFNTSNVTNMRHMFLNCTNLNTLDIRNFDFLNVTNYNYIFEGVNSKVTIYAKNETARTFILNLSASHRPLSWSTSNILIPTPTIELNKQPGTYTGRQLVEISPSKWYTKDVNYLYCISSDNKECIPTLVGIDTETINLKPGNNYKICATTSGNKVSNTWCTDTYRVKKENYDIGDEIYYNPETGEMDCTEYTEDNSLNENKSGCMKWYAIKDKGSTVDVLLDHNTTYNVAYSTLRCEPTLAISQLASDVSGWIDEAKNSARLITADEVWEATKSTNGAAYWRAATATEKDYFYFKSTGKEYAWLLDYTSGCTSYGCNKADSNTGGYWTSTIVGENNQSTYSSSDNKGKAQQMGLKASQMEVACVEYVWYVNSIGKLDAQSDTKYSYDRSGIRPVITISKEL